MSIAALVETLLVAGVDHATVVAAVRAVETGVETSDTAAERRRAYDRERMRAKRAAEKSADNPPTSDDSADSSDIKKVNDTQTLSEPLENNLTKKYSPPSGVRIAPTHTRAKGASRTDLRDALTAILSVDMADAVIDHRKAKKAPLTVKAAELLAKRLAACPDPDGAAALMIEKGWQSIDPNWEGVRSMSAPTPADAKALAASGMVYIQAESPQWDAWTRYRRRTTGTSPPRDKNGGWWFPTEWPPEEATIVEEEIEF